MNFRETPIPGLLLVDQAPQGDERGTFTRLYCRATFEEIGLEPVGEQWSLSKSTAQYTLRGLHYQAPPQDEAKLISCVAGVIFDVVVDIRPQSPTYGRPFCVELNADIPLSLYVPRGFAHGFLSLRPSSHVLYGMGTAYHAESARGLRWNDPTIGVQWPHMPSVISERDAALPLLMEIDEHPVTF